MEVQNLCHWTEKHVGRGDLPLGSLAKNPSCASPAFCGHWLSLACGYITPVSVISSPSLLSVKSPSAFLIRMLRDLQHIGLIQDHLPIPRALTFNYICKDSFFFFPKYRTIYRFQGLESDILKGPLLGLTTVISLN